MARDLDAGASWLVAEGRESGTVGLFEPDGEVRVELVEAIVAAVPVDRVIFEAPQRAQQSVLINLVGPNVGLGNIPPDEAALGRDAAPRPTQRHDRPRAAGDLSLGGRLGRPASRDRPRSPVHP